MKNVIDYLKIIKIALEVILTGAIIYYFIQIADRVIDTIDKVDEIVAQPDPYAAEEKYRHD